MQELIVIDDLLYSLIGIEGRYISIKRARGKDDSIIFQVDSSMDLALQVEISPFHPRSLCLSAAEPCYFCKISESDLKFRETVDFEGLLMWREVLGCVYFNWLKTPLQDSAKRIFPLCESYLLVSQFVESRSQFKTGLVNHAFAAALRALLLVVFPSINISIIVQ